MPNLWEDASDCYDFGHIQVYMNALRNVYKHRQMSCLSNQYCL